MKERRSTDEGQAQGKNMPPRKSKPRAYDGKKNRKKNVRVRDVAEYGGRKTFAIVLWILAAFLFILFFFIGLASQSFFLILIGLLLAIFFGAYGGHYWKKVTFLMWTRQAMREYNAPRTRDVQKNVRRKEPHSNYNQKASTPSHDSKRMNRQESQQGGYSEYQGKTTDQKGDISQRQNQYPSQKKNQNKGQFSNKKGFNSEAVGEYYGRKGKAIGIILLGFGLIGFGILSLFFAIHLWEAFSIGLLLVIIFFITGVITLGYGAHYWSKVTFVSWTRQAMREYNAPRTRDIQKNVGKAQPSSHPKAPVRQKKDGWNQQSNQGQQMQVQKKQIQQQQESNLCPDCGQTIRYLEEYDSWYCDRCQDYK